MTAANCEKHPFDLAESACYDCGYDACKACLVFARGPKKPPICLDCSIAAAGVRSKSVRQPKYIAKDMKVVRRRLAKELKEQRAAASRLVDFDQIPPFDPATDLAPEDAPFEPITQPRVKPIDESTFEPLPEPALVPDGEQSLDDRLAGSLPPLDPQPAEDTAVAFSTEAQPAFAASPTPAPPPPADTAVAFDTQADFFDTPSPAPAQAPPPPADTAVPFDTQADFFDTPSAAPPPAPAPPPADTAVPFDTQADFFDTPSPAPAQAPPPPADGAADDSSREQMPTLDWSQDWSDDWNAPPVATGN